MVHFFLILQCLLFLFMVLHDWIDIPPFTNLEALKKAHTFKFRLFGSILNGILVLVPIIVTLIYFNSHLAFWARLLFTFIYGFVTMGTITAWWIPYFGGGYLIHGNEAGFEEYKNTHTFLPRRGENVVPNTLHVILHIQVWTCFGLSLYWLVTGGWNNT